MPLLTLNCFGTKVSDLLPLEDCKSLKQLILLNTKVTPAGVAALQTALPNCKIDWDDPAAKTPATTDPQRRVAEWILSKGGTIILNGGVKATESKELPAGLIQVVSVTLTSKGLSAEDTNLVLLRGLPQLSFLLVYGSTASPEGIAGLEELPALQQLSWGMLTLDSKAVTAISRLKHLNGLYLAGLTINAGQLEGLVQAAPYLTSLNLQGAKTNDDQGFRSLDDKSVLSLGGFKKLEILQLRGTKVTADGIASLQKALPNCQIEWDDPAKKAMP